MKVVYFSARSHDYAAKALVEMLRLSNRYRNGVVRLPIDDDNLIGPWSIAVVTGAPLEFSYNKKNSAFFDIYEGSLKEIWNTVESKAKEAGLI